MFQLQAPRYRLLSQLGEGGMGSVYRAFDRLSGQVVALKGVLLEDHDQDRTLGSIAAEGGDYTTAQALLEESLALRRALRDAFGIVSTLTNLGWVALCLGNHAAAWASYAEGIALAFEIGDREGVAYHLSGLAILAQACGAPARAALGDPAFQSAWEAGASQPWEQAVRDALDVPLTPPADPGSER